MDFETNLRAKNVALSYPFYSGWQYDQPYETDPFLVSLLSGITIPMIQMMESIGAIQIYPCSRMSSTQHSGSAVLEMNINRDTTNGLCDAQRGEIFVAREFESGGQGQYITTENPGFIIAHEIFHIIDARAGDWIPDGAGDAELRPMSAIKPFFKEAFIADQNLKPQAIKNNEKKTLYRKGLLGDNEGLRNSAVEISCDMAAHILTGEKPALFQRLSESHPNLKSLTSVMLSVASTPDGFAKYHELINEGASISDISIEFTEPQWLAQHL